MRIRLLSIVFFVAVLLYEGCTFENNYKQKYNYFNSFELEPKNNSKSNCKRFSVLPIYRENKITNFIFTDIINNTIILTDTIIYYKNKPFLVHESYISDKKNLICTFKEKNPIELRFHMLNDEIQLFSILKFSSSENLELQNTENNLYNAKFKSFEDFLQSSAYIDIKKNLKNYGKGGGGIEISYKACQYIAKPYRFFISEGVKTYSIPNYNDKNDISYDCLYLDRNINLLDDRI